MGGTAKVSRKMHLLYRNYSKCMDALPQVVNDVYHNFTSMAHLIDVAIRKFDTKNVAIRFDTKKFLFLGITRNMQQLTGFIRWALKWCVNEGGTINWSFVDLLADTESYFIQTLLLLSDADQPPDLRLLRRNLDDISPDFKSLVSKILGSDLIFWENLEPSIFMFSEESVMKRLDQAIEDEYIYKKHRKECLFLKKFIQFNKEHTDRASWGYIYPWVDCALDMMSLYFINYRNRKRKSDRNFDDVTEKIDEFIHILILHMLELNSGSTPPFTDELLVFWVEYLQKFLLNILDQKHWSGHEFAINEYKKTKQIGDVLSLVHSIVSHTPKHEIDYEKLSHTKKLINTVLRKLDRIISSFFTRVFVRYKTSLEISHCLCGIFQALLVPLDSDGFLSDETLIKYAYYFQNYEFQLPTNDEDIDMTSPTQDRSNFYDDLAFMARVVFYQWSEYHVERETLLNGRVEMVGVLRDLGSIICSSLNNEVEGNIQIEMNPGLPHLLAKFEHVKIQFTSTIPLTILKELSARNPETDLLGFLNSLFENLEELRSDFNFVRDWKDQLQTIQGDLFVFRSFLQNIRDNSIKDDRSRDLSMRIRNFAYDAEYIIHAFFAGAIHVCCRSFIISDLIEEGNLIKEKANAKEIIIEGSTHVLSQDLVPTTNPKKDVVRMSSRAPIPPTDVVVGFKAEKRLMMECLASDRKQLDVISIVGMGGIGKTTLAKKVYEDPYIVNHFQHRAWCSVSQEYGMKTLLLSILGTDETDPDTCEDLSLMLHKKLKGRKYLIVLDDVWDIDMFYELKRCFPSDDNGSRVVLTTRTMSIGLQAKKHSDPIELHPLSDDESWNLLKQKAFPEQECPLELFQIGKKIVRKCGGLPLAVVVVAGILAKSDKEQYVWEEVAERLDIYTGDDSQGEMSMKALDLSYELLPDHLKPLFLYVGAFPEDHNIRAKNLKWLWIAEGFIMETEKMSLEVQAETYLMDLVDRSLLMVTKRNSSGSVRTCGIHDLMRDMSLAKAKAEYFMQHHNIEGIEYLSEQHLIYPRRVSLSLIDSKGESTPTPSIANEALPPHPLVTYEELSRLSMTTRLNSLLLFNIGRRFNKRTEFCKSIFQNHKMLRVFHTDKVYLKEPFFTNVTPPVHLRYISVDGASEIPSSVFRLWSLETLILNGFSLANMQVSGEFWYMAKLRHLHINRLTSFGDPVDDSRKLENLQTLSKPVFRGEETKLIGRFPNLKKLKCYVNNKRGSICELPRLESLHQLESVWVEWLPNVPCQGQLRLPSTLKKLSLFGFRFQWKDITNFQELPNLEILKLGHESVEDGLWDMGDGEFTKLKFLMLRNLNIKSWIASRENFPCLQNLVLFGCRELEDIPSGLGDICSLEKIEVISCSYSASESAKRIRQEQEEMGNDELKVYISHPMPMPMHIVEDSDSDSE